MLRKLRLKFVIINMAIVTAMLCVIFGLIYHSTRVDLEQENLNMMRAIASFPALDRPGRPDQLPEEVRLPYFTLENEADGSVSAFGGGYYGLSDRLSSRPGGQGGGPGDTGVLEDYNLRFCRVSPPWGSGWCFRHLQRAGHPGQPGAHLPAHRRPQLPGLPGAEPAAGPVGGAPGGAGLAAAAAVRGRRLPRAENAPGRHHHQRRAAGGEGGRRGGGAHPLHRPADAPLVEGLLELARADGGAAETPMERVDWSAVVSDALLPFEPVFFERGLTLTPRVQPGLAVWGRADQLRQVVDVLLDNARKYAQAPSAVYLHLDRMSHSRCLLMVENRADPLSPEELEDIFKRFYRTDKARSRDGSFGLGLAIARQIAAAHRGRIWAESRDGWVRFYIELPLG